MAINKKIYDLIKAKKIINAAGTYTIIGGSKMSEKTLEDMNNAARSHVEIRELQKIVHEKLAKLTNNEGAYISNGAACGTYLAFAAAAALKENKKFNYISNERMKELEVVTFRAHRNPYDIGIELLGVKIIELGYPNIILPATKEDIENSISENTIAIYFAAGSEGGWIPKGEVSLEDTVEIAKKNNIPIIVDAAAQLPPVENLWNYTKKGADIALFSGGKDLRGPQSSGLIVGKKEIIDRITEIGFPNYGVGRMFKVGREEIIGLYSAVEQYITMDHQKRKEWCEEIIVKLTKTFENSKLFQVLRTYPNEAGQPIPRAFIKIIDENRITGENLKKLLLEGEYHIFVNTEDLNGVYINPMTLVDEEIDIIEKRLIQIEKELN